MAHALIRCVTTFSVIISLWVVSQAQERIGPNLRVIAGTEPNVPLQTPQFDPCPEPESIAPCFCLSDDQYEMDMVCSDVTSEEELRNIFNQEFPFSNFSTLMIEGNDNIQTLRTNDLGNTSFGFIEIRVTGLTEIEDGALAGSYDTLTDLNLADNRLTSPPDISFFKHLLVIAIGGNNLMMFPKLTSPTLTYLYVDSHHFEQIPADAVEELPALELFQMASGPLLEVPAGVFTSRQNLSMVSFLFNNLTTLPENAVHLHGDESQLLLSGNRITHIPKGAFSGVTGSMYMNRNLLEELDEEVWRPLLEDNVELYIEDNPFGCECDIAWLIVNQTLLDRVTDVPTCSDGTRFSDLDPAYYEEMC